MTSSAKARRLKAEADRMYEQMKRDMMAGRLTMKTMEADWVALAAELEREAKELDAALFSDGMNITIEEIDRDEDVPQRRQTTAVKKPTTTPPSPPGTKPISIRVPYRIVHAFMELSKKTGAPYQRLMNQALAEWSTKALKPAL